MYLSVLTYILSVVTPSISETKTTSEWGSEMCLCKSSVACTSWISRAFLFHLGSVKNSSFSLTFWQYMWACNRSPNHTRDRERDRDRDRQRQRDRDRQWETHRQRVREREWERQRQKREWEREREREESKGPPIPLQNAMHILTRNLVLPTSQCKLVCNCYVVFWIFTVRQDNIPWWGSPVCYRHTCLQPHIA